jgi:hypothetical protein
MLSREDLLKLYIFIPPILPEISYKTISGF